MQNGQERKPDLVCSLEKEGFLGSFYQGDRYVDKAVIFVGGSGEPRNVVEARAAILAREGYSVLAVGYYLWKPLSKQTVAIPLDYVERAIDWLKGKCPVKVTKIGMIGLAGAIPVLLGDNIGTTITALLASIGQSKNAKRTAIAEESIEHITFDKFAIENEELVREGLKIPAVVG